MSKVTYRVYQSTDGVDVGVFSGKYDEPSINFSRIPRCSLSVPNDGGINAEILDIGKEIQIFRENELVFTGIIESNKPSKTNENSDLDVTCVEKNYHFLRRQFCHSYDVDGDGNIQFNSASNSGATINNWDFGIFRDPNGIRDVYNLPPALSGVTPDEIIQMIIQEKSIFQFRFDNPDMFAANTREEMNLAIYGTGAAGAFLGHKDQSLIAQGTSISLVHNDPNLFENPIYDSAEVEIIGETLNIDYEDDSGNNKDLSPIGNLGVYVDTEPRFGTGVKFISGDTYLLRTDSDFDIRQDLSIAMRFKLDYNGTAQWLTGSGHVDGDEYQNNSFELHLDTLGRIVYTHGINGGGDWFRVLSVSQYNTDAEEKIIAPGEHVLYLHRDFNNKRVKVFVDGEEYINTTWAAGEDPAPTYENQFAHIFTLGQRAPRDNYDYNVFKGSISEFRIWDSLISEAVLSDILDKDTTNYPGETLEGTELAAYFFSGIDTSFTNPSFKLGASGFPDDTVTLSTTQNYLGSSLTQWSGNVNFSQQGDELVFRLTLPSGIAMKIYYLKIIANSTTTNFPVTSGTITPYTAPVETDLLMNGAGNWVETDLLSTTKLEAIEKVRVLTENDGTNNTTPFWDIWFDVDGQLNFDKRRGSDIGLIYSFEQGNIESINHEFFGAQLSYQTTAYGIGTGNEQSRLVSREEFYNGGLYDSNRDPAPGAKFITDLTVEPLYNRLVDATNRHLSQAFKTPSGIEGEDFIFSFHASTNKVSNTEVFDIFIGDTYDNPLFSTTLAISNMTNQRSLHVVTIPNVTIDPETEYFITIRHSGAANNDSMTVSLYQGPYAHGNMYYNGTEVTNHRLSCRFEFVSPKLTYGDLPRQIRFVDSNERSTSSLLHKARVFHKLHRDPVETLSVTLSGDFIRYFNVGDRLQFEDVETKTNSLLRVVDISREFGETEKVTVKLGESPATTTESIQEANQNSKVITLKAQELKNILEIELDDGSSLATNVKKITFSGDQFSLTPGNQEVDIDLDLDMGEW